MEGDEREPVKRVELGNGAKRDLFEASTFWELQESGLGDRFYDEMSLEILSLEILSGLHPERNGVFRMRVGGKFPYYAVFYRIEVENVLVLAVIDQRRDPAWVRAFLSRRLRE
ncbi:type II toxin-antitoxin system RelE/ParE family toxin [Phragmitibacter flavus]|uniref:Type II toxin-antitoxin system RelE/ParE family toxin n=1 Tax=Phragmitibacter flavus TaxID=2576071 RepID=A0A5R8KJ41_9BACT|nr:type II toxin-antitoxin system RelE/ParE family toxin [Phragmitibacter flavus]